MGEACFLLGTISLRSHTLQEWRRREGTSGQVSDTEAQDPRGRAGCLHGAQLGEGHPCMARCVTAVGPWAAPPPPPHPWRGASVGCRGLVPQHRGVDQSGGWRLREKGTDRGCRRRHRPGGRPQAGGRSPPPPPPQAAAGAGRGGAGRARRSRVYIPPPAARCRGAAGSHWRRRAAAPPRGGRAALCRARGAAGRAPHPLRRGRPQRGADPGLDAADRDGGQRGRGGGEGAGAAGGSPCGAAALAALLPALPAALSVRLCQGSWGGRDVRSGKGWGGGVPVCGGELRGPGRPRGEGAALGRAGRGRWRREGGGRGSCLPPSHMRSAGPGRAI